MKILSKYKSQIICLLVVILACGIVLVNYLYIRPLFPEYDSLLRCFDHFISGISIPFLFYMLTKNISLSCVFYFLTELFWELYQFSERGYFQFNQFIADILGILVIFIILNYWYKNIRPNTSTLDSTI